MKIILVIIIVVHAVIQLIGFSKGLNNDELYQLKSSVSKPMAILWLLAFILLITTAFLVIFNSSFCWIIGIAAVILSQLLIILYWQEAKFGTLPNILIAAVCIFFYASWDFYKEVKQESNLLKLTAEPFEIEKQQVLPEIIQEWLDNAGVNSDNSPSSVEIKQVGRMKIKPESSWLPFEAEQIFTLSKPQFIWNAKVGSGHFMQFSGRDAYIENNGSMKILLYGLFPVVNSSGEDIDNGVAIRYLSEIVWFPWAAQSSYITWTTISKNQAEATLKDGDIEVTGAFTFDDLGNPIGFETMRYNEELKKEALWKIEVSKDSQQTFNNITIPTKATVTWKINEEDFTWLEVELVDFNLYE
ncbi:MAG: DUF6544 family protein [Brumimicrobium sp.]